MWTVKSVVSTWTIGTGYTERYDIDEDLDELLMNSSDVKYFKKHYGLFTIMVTLLVQLFILTMLISLCGIVPLSTNGGVGPCPDALLMVGATNPYLLSIGHECWRLLVSPFVPTSVIHFVFNLAIQSEIGAFLEKDWVQRGGSLFI
jgi:membrane associated rhomboid family serine protease